MKWYRRFTSVALALVLLVGVSCTSDTTGVDVPVTQEPQPEPTVETSLLLGDLLGGVGRPIEGVLDLIGGVVRPILDITGLLSCSVQRYEVEYETIGPQGGAIRVGDHLLVIPRGALSHRVRIKAEQIPGPTNSVRFSPELTFNKSATLTLSYDNCSKVDAPKAVVYTDENLEPIDILLSVDLFRWKKVAARIDHFSRYAVAW